MPVISVFKYGEDIRVDEIVSKLDGKKIEDGVLKARKSKFNSHEAIVEYRFEQEVEELIKRVLPETLVERLARDIKENGNSKVENRVLCFFNTLVKTFEVYRGPDGVTETVVAGVSKLLGIRLRPLTLSSQALRNIYLNHSKELRQALFKNVDGLLFETLKGRCLEKNWKFVSYTKKFPHSLRVITFRPSIKFLNGGCKYHVTINGDKGTIKFSGNGDFKWRPRLEVRQLVYMMALSERKNFA